MKLDIIAIDYNVDIQLSDFINLIEYEDLWNGGIQKNEYTLLDALADIGCQRIEYSGHFGSAIWFTLQRENDNTETHGKILELIQSHLTKANKWKLCYEKTLEITVKE